VDAGEERGERGPIKDSVSEEHKLKPMLQKSVDLKVGHYKRNTKIAWREAIGNVA
jgi:hypothetical protein